MNNIVCKANAKINLGLRIKFKRKDNFHEIESIFQEIDFADSIILKQNAGIHFSTTSNELKFESNNLCVRAAELLMQEFGIDGLDIHLDKIIPIGAGLGGGSSDAAAILKGAMKLYDLRIDNNNILKLAARLGSDVPFFLNGKTAHVSGRGEIIQPIKFKLKYYVLLVISSFKISTAEAYKRHNIHLTKNEYDYKFDSSILSGLNVSSFKNIFYNDFEKSVLRDYSELADIKNLLYIRGAKFASLSGSGSTVFGLFLTQKEVQQAYLSLSEKYICIIANPVY